jgi:rSAM/selenodomain-associated transferase 1
VSDRILVFARAPVPGHTKTRLIPALGAAGAAALHGRLVERTLGEARLASSARTELWCADPPEHPFYSDCARRFGVDRRAQTGEDLGQRMNAALADALARARVAVLIGTDSPDLDHGDLEAALLRLRRGIPVVLGPATDGGYVLIGLRRPMPGLFEGIDWGTNRVLEQTRRRLREIDSDWMELAPRHDIDRPADLVLLPADLR